VAHAAGTEAWLLDYRLAPEHPYPAAREDALSAYKDLLDWGIEPSQIIIAGDSAGGGLTLSTALGIRNAGWPMPAALVLLSPWTDLSLSSPSYQHNKKREAMLTAGFLSRAAAHYCNETNRGRATRRQDSGASPFFADLAGLPPMLAHVGGDEILLDDARLVIERADAAGGEATLRVFDELWHVFQASAGALPEADESLREIGDFCRAQLARRA
jgi:acetyl esterase/lipase